MGGGSEALLEVWRAPLDLYSENFEYKKKTELVQISIQMRIYAVEGRADALPSALVNQRGLLGGCDAHAGGETLVGTLQAR
jgi:hypothetical protein